MVKEVCIGQMIDVDLGEHANPTSVDVLEKNRLKTAYYSVVRPMHLGAIAAGEHDALPAWEAFGKELGLMYQLQDDLLDTYSLEVSGKPAFSDVIQGQPTLLSLHIKETDPQGYAVLAAAQGGELSATSEEKLRHVFESSGAIEFAEAKLKEYDERLATLADSFDTESEQALAHHLRKILNKRDR